MDKLTVSQKQQIMKNRNWRINQLAGYSWYVWDGKGKVAGFNVSKSAAIHEAYEKFLAWQNQDRLARIALGIVNWKAPYSAGDRL